MLNSKIFILFFMLLLVSNFASAQVRDVECSTNSDCGNGYICEKAYGPNQWTCIRTSGDTSSQLTSTSSFDNSILVASIIGGCVIVGLIILGLILRRKKK